MKSRQVILNELSTINNLAFIYGLKGVMNDVTGHIDAIYDARFDPSLLSSAYKLASRAIPNMAVLILKRVAADAADQVLRTAPHRFNHELYVAIKKLSAMI